MASSITRNAFCLSGLSDTTIHLFEVCRRYQAHKCDDNIFLQKTLRDLIRFYKYK